MIHKENLEDGLIKTYSDTYKIRKVGTDEIYSEAIDVVDSSFVYEETDMPLKMNEESFRQMMLQKFRKEQERVKMKV